MNPISRIFLGGLIALALADLVPAQSRTWGFDRDTVFERSPSSEDTTSLNAARLVNSGSAVLHIDSLRVELLRPMNVDSIAIGFLPPAYPHFFVWKWQGSNAVNFQVPAGGSGLFRHFQADRFWAEFLAKRVAMPDYGDTLLVRLRFIARDGTQDTLLLRGRVEGYWHVSLRPIDRRLKVPVSFSGLARDLRGRTLPAARPAVPVFLTP